MTRMTPTFKMWTLIGAMLFIGALATTGCDSSEDECVGVGCLTPTATSGVDAGNYDLPCNLVCEHLYEFCDTPPFESLPKIRVDNDPVNLQDCILICEKGFSLDERMCLSRLGTDCREASACLATE